MIKDDNRDKCVLCNVLLPAVTRVESIGPLVNSILFIFFIQMNLLLNFCEEREECPCPEGIQELLQDFHADLMTHCGE